MHSRTTAHARPAFCCLLIGLLGLAPLHALTEEATAPSEKPSAPIAPAEAKVFNDFNKIIADANGLLPVNREVFEGSSLLPFGSRAKAIEEAKAKSTKAKYNALFIERDYEERRTGIISGVHRVIQLRGIMYIEKTPENVMNLVEQGPVGHLSTVLTDALKQPVYVPHLPRMKELVRQAAARGGSVGLSAAALVDVVVAQEGKAAIEDLKKWAKYHPQSPVRKQAYVGLIQTGELDFVESTLKEDQDKVLQLQVGERIKQARLGA